MSYSQRPSSRPTMHCKVCESAKKSPAVIASHFPKNRDGFTVCPTLLAQQCRGCGKKGHTIGYCTLKQEPTLVEKVPRMKESIQKTNPKTKVQSVYDALYVSDAEEDAEEEADVVVKEKKNKPEKTLKEKTVKSEPKKFCWATAESDSSGSDDSDSD